MKRNIKLIIYISIIVLVVVISQLTVNNLFKDEHKMLEAFSGTNSNMERSQLTVVANYGLRFLTDEDKRSLIQYVAKQIGISDELEVDVQKGKNTVTYSGERKAQEALTQIQLISIVDEKDPTAKTEQYIYVNLNIYDNMDCILDYKSLVESSLNELDLVSINSSIKIEGTYDGKLSLKERNEIVDKLLADMQGQIVNQNRSETIYTVYAYTSLIGEYMTVEGDRVNMNLVFTYDEQNDKTILYLATPILNEDF